MDCVYGRRRRRRRDKSGIISLSSLYLIFPKSQEENRHDTKSSFIVNITQIILMKHLAPKQQQKVELPEKVKLLKAQVFIM